MILKTSKTKQVKILKSELIDIDLDNEELVKSYFPYTQNHILNMLYIINNKISLGGQEKEYHLPYLLTNKILKRDNYSCIFCKSKDKSKLQIHHIIPREVNSYLTYNEYNLITLCKLCHKKIQRVWNLTFNLINNIRWDNTRDLIIKIPSHPIVSNGEFKK